MPTSRWVLLGTYPKMERLIGSQDGQPKKDAPQVSLGREGLPSRHLELEI